MYGAGVGRLGSLAAGGEWWKSAVDRFAAVAAVWAAAAIGVRGKRAEAALRRRAAALERRAADQSQELARAQGQLDDRIAEAIRAQETLECLFNLAMDMICIAGIDGYFRRVNPAFTRTLGYTEEELLARPFLDFVHPDDLPATQAIVEKLAAGQDAVDFENRYRCKDGSYRWLAWRTPAPLPGSELLYAVARDVTDHKRTEMELRKAMAASEAASRAKSEFVANMSHEIRTPLNGILGMTELALGADLGPRVRDYLETISQSAELLLMIVNDILDFSKMEAGKFQLDSTPFRLRETLEVTVQALAARAHQKGLELAFHVDPRTPDALVGDPVRLRQVITNLVGNAIKFTDRGEVLLHVEPEDDGGKPRAAPAADAPVCLHFLVRDTGIGISEDKQEMIFEAFSQADMSTTRKYGGTGLGLTISSYLAQQMGGRIWVESREGAGSAFHFTARFALPEQPAPPLAALPPEAVGLPVLVVDDNRTNRRILEEMLSGWGLKVTLAESGPAALEKLEQARRDQRPFRIAILDFHMPGMDGWELAQRITAHEEWAGTLVMVLTSSDRPGDCVRFEELGVAAYLAKPVRQEKLRQALIAALSGQPARDAKALPAPAPQLGKRLRVLLAEDSAVNQKLVVELLAQQGHEVVLASTGREAVRVWESQPFDLVLMDVQMPDLDGLEATRRIRAREYERGERTPIVAMTAHAMQGDRERCLAAGMDDYLAKPVRPRELLAKIAETLAPSNGPPAAPPAESPARGPSELAPEPLHWEQAVEEMGGDEQLLRELAQTLLDEAPRLLAHVRQAVEQRNPHALRLAAHTIKGSVRPFAAEQAAEYAFRLENMGRRGDLTGAPGALRELERALARLVEALQARLQS